MKDELNKTETLRETLDSHSKINYINKLELWINKNIVKKISKTNNEPSWMLDLRLKALDIFNKKELPKWGPSLKKLDLQQICYFWQAEWSGSKKSWEDVPNDIKNTFDKLWIPEAEKKALAWVWAQYDSEVVYHSIKEEYSKLWVIFEDMSVALNKYENIIKKYFSKCIPLADHKFASLHYAVWSWGTFLYIPKWVKLSEPLQSYFRMNMQAGWQFEHTLIILEEWAEASYIEWCSAPKFNESSLHAGWVEIFVWKNAKMRYSS